MKNTFLNLKQFVVSSLVIGSLLVAPVVHAGSDVEYYTDRPNILTLESEADNQQNWERLRWAQTEFVAQLFGLYPTETLYFLARDGEYPYDLALLLTRKHPELRARLKLINVSRGNERSRYLQQYLLQEGITEEAIAKNGLVFVDTGFKGNIGRRLRNFYPSELHSKMRIHLIESDVDDIAESAVFRTKKSMGVEDFEGMPRYSYRSDNFVQHKGRLVPTSQVLADGYKDDEGEVSKRRSLKYMKGTVAFTENPEVMKLFESRIEQWVYGRKFLDDHSKSLKEIRNFTAHLLKTWEDSAKNAFVRDLVEYFVLNSKKRLVPDDDFFFMTKKWFPDWDEILHDWKNNYADFLKGAIQTDLLDLANLTLRHYEYEGKDSKERAVTRRVKSGEIDLSHSDDDEEKEMMLRKSISPVAQIVNSMNLGQAMVFFSEIEAMRGVEIRNQIFESLRREISSPEKIWKQIAQRFEVKSSKKADDSSKKFIDSLQDKRVKPVKCKHLFF